MNITLYKRIERQQEKQKEKKEKQKARDHIQNDC